VTVWKVSWEECTSAELSQAVCVNSSVKTARLVLATDSAGGLLKMMVSKKGQSNPTEFTVVLKLFAVEASSTIAVGFRMGRVFIKSDEEATVVQPCDRTKSRNTGQRASGAGRERPQAGDKRVRGIW